MTISKEYSDTLKGRAVSRFIKDKGRAPTSIELRDLVRKEQRQYPSVDLVGISGYDIVKPGFREVSSVTNENQNRHAAYDDLATINTKLDNLSILLEDGFRGFYGAARRTNRLLKQLESRIDNLLLLNGSVDVFVDGFEETFDTQEYVDFDNTTAEVCPGYVTLGRTSVTSVPLDEVRIIATATSEKNIIGSQTSSDINLLKSNDGSFWEHLVYTKSRQGRVSSLIQFDLPEPLYVGDFKFTTSTLSVNQKMTATVFYSLDGSTWVALEPAEVVIDNSENSFNIGLEGVQKIQLMLSKSVSDNTTTAGNQYVYVFSLDSVDIQSDRYTDNKESVFYAGPYNVTNEEGNPVYFTKATLSACVNSPEDTSIAFFLSKDNLSWKPVNWRDEANNVVSFASGSAVGTSVLLDDSKSETSLIESTDVVQEVDFKTEALLNKAIHADYADSVPFSSIKVKRNLAIDKDIYNVTSGWFFNQQTETYSTTIYVGASEGRNIDVGHTSVYVNGALRSGLVELKKGYSLIETSDANWYELPAAIDNVDQMKKLDPLYPYNHAYLFTGYDYAKGFKGERVYNGVDDYFGKLLQYLPPEEFNILDNSRLDVFTLEDVDGNLYVKVKVNKTFASWKDEEFDVDWIVQSDNNNQLYVKAVLTTSFSEKTPKIEHYMVRVI